MVVRYFLNPTPLSAMRTRFFALLAALLVVAPAAFGQQRATDEARDHVQRNAFHYGLTAADLSELTVTDAYASRRSGATHVYLQQALGGIPIVGAEFSVALNRDGHVFHAAGRGADRLAERRVASSPSVTAEAAAAAVARDAGLAPTAFRVLTAEGTAAAPVLTLSEGGVAQEPVAARLVYRYDAEADAVALAWEVGLYEVGSRHYWLGWVDAVTGAVLARHDLVVHDTFGPAHDAAEEAPSYAPLASTGPAPLAAVGSYRVYPYPVESPYYSVPPTPADGRTLEVDPDDPVASPFGWHDTDGVAGPEYTRTRGNNVHAYTDTNNNDQPDPGSDPDGGAGLVFDFPIDLTQAPSTYRPAAVTNLFYWNNIFHDVMWHHGFDEAAGNFQVNNYGNGGLGNDDVRAEAQDGGGTNNANMFTPVDGQRPRMQMYIGTAANPDTDGDLDNLVIMHEYSHGISNRLVGGPSNVGCLSNSEQPGEGISDWHGLMLTEEGGSDGTDPRGVGTYLFGQGPEGPGIRDAPYSTSFAVNSFTYQDTRTRIIPHGVGFVWATIWWEVTRDMIAAFGYDNDLWDASGTAGNQVMLQLMTEAMKLVPCSPGFVDFRDAMFTADQTLYGGAYCSTMWPAFARRGLGVNASQGSPFTNSDNTDGFTAGTCAGGSGVTVTVTPTSTTSIPAGGAITMDLEVVIDAGGPSSFDIWGDVTRPSGTVVTVLGPRTVSVTPGTTITRSITLNVPGSASSGSYSFDFKTGTHPGTVLASDGFGFTVTPAPLARQQAHDARATGDWALVGLGEALGAGDVLDLRTTPTTEAAAASAAGLPTEAALHAAFPNPFGERATLRYDVATAGPVRIAVYDLLGREVAVLVDGAQEPGRHAVALDAQALSNGVYLVRMTAPDASRTTRITVAR